MKLLKIAFVLVLFALSCLAPNAWAEVTVAETDAIPGEISDLEVDYVAGEILVGFRPGANPERARRELGASQIRRFDHIRVRHWKLPRGLSVEKAMAILEKQPNIEYAEPNYLMNLDVLSGDEFFVDLWGLHNVGQTGGTADADIDAPEAWDSIGAYDASEVVIAVLDTGIDPDHEEFVGNLWNSPDGSYGWDFVHDNNEPIDDHGHGTHVAGTICANGDNAAGVAGVVWSCQLMVLKMADATGRLTLDAAIAAIEYASENGADIISASWGGEERSNSLKNAINAFDGLFVAAAGNSRTSKAHYPAAFPAEHIISVAATDHNDELASFSNYSSRLVDLGAPGVDILSSLPGNQYGLKSGTSMATPHVTGVAAMVMAQLGGASPLEVKAHILEGVDHLTALQGLTVTGGRLNAHAAVGGSTTVDPDIKPPFPVTDLVAVASIDSWDSIHLYWKATSDDDGDPVFAYDIRYSTDKAGLLGDNWLNASQVEGEPAPGTLGSDETMTVRQLEGDTIYYFAIRTIDEVALQSVTSETASARTNLNPWLTEVVDEAPGALFFPSIAVHPHTGESAMAYFFGGDAYYAIREDDNWSIMTIGPEGSGISLAFDPGTWNPAVSHSNDGTLEFVHYQDGAWLTEEVDSDDVDTRPTSLAFGPDGQPCIFYGTDQGKNKRRVQQLKFACRQNTGWSTDVIATTGNARYRTLAFEIDGTPLLAYSHDTNDDGREDSVKLARLREAGWEIETVTGSEQVNWDLRMAYNADTGPLLVAHGYGPLRMYYQTEEGWQTAVINDESEGNPDIAIDSTGMPWISYRNYASDPDQLVVARPVDDTFAQWNLTVVDSAGIYDSSIAINHNDLPVIAYGHVDDQYVKWAELQPMNP